MNIDLSWVCRSWAWILHEVEPTILGTAKEIRNTVAVEIDHCRTDIVPLNVLGCKGAYLFETPRSINFTQTFIKISVGAIEQNVENSIAVPVNHAQLASTTRPGGFAVKTQGIAFGIAQNAL
jgi:hypothetical protein